MAPGPAGAAASRAPIRARLVRGLYTTAWRLLLPAAFGYLGWRGLRQPAYREHWGERLGFGGTAPAGFPTVPPIWIHAVSVGETRAALPLIEALARRDPTRGFLLTHTTPTGRETGAEVARRLPGRVAQCYLPYDLPGAIERFLGRWRPACGLLIETEVWPNLAAVCARADVPLALVNGRLSERSLRRGERQAALIEPALAALAAVVVQTPDDAARLERLGRRADAICGNLKYDIEPPPDLVERGRHWREDFGPRPVVLAASTRDGEEALLIEAWRDALAARATGPGAPPLLVVVPRHPQRFDDVALALVTAFGAKAVGRRADLGAVGDPGEPSGPAHVPVDGQVGRGRIDRLAVLLGDSMGEMPAWYAAADVAIIGGSLLPFGAQNLIEANAVGCPVVLGPSTYNFAQAAEASVAAGAAVAVADARGAVDEALAIATNPARQARMAAAARAFTAAHRGATARTLIAIEPMLPAPVSAPASVPGPTATVS